MSDIDVADRLATEVILAEGSRVDGKKIECVVSKPLIVCR